MVAPAGWRAARAWLVLQAALVALGVAAEDKDLGGGWQQTTNDEGKVVQQLKIEAPSMTEEDQYGYVMPDRYRCDSCKAVMFHLDQGLRAKHPKSRRMKEWEYTDVFEDVCKTAFPGYGIKLINGENALSGPGLPRNEQQLAPGSGAIQMSSENWSKRLGEICRNIVFENLGEDETYERFYKKFRKEQSGKDQDDEGGEEEAGLSETLCAKELRQCNVGPKLPSETPKSKKEKKEKKDKKGKDVKVKDQEKKDKHGKKTPAKESSGGSEKVDVKTFLRKLAVSHGLTSDEYLADRTSKEWEKLMTTVAGRIFNRAEL